MRRLLRDRAVGLGHGDHRLGRALHHRQGLGRGLGETPGNPLAARAAARSGSSGPGRGVSSAAEALFAEGYDVVVYDRHDRAGGLLIYGIPNFKLEKLVVERRTKRLVKGGVEFRLGFEVGRDATLEQLRERHDAVLLATGVWTSGRATSTAPGVGSTGVVPALEYLVTENRRRAWATPRPSSIWTARRQGQGRGGGRRRRHRHGLRAHRRAPGRGLGDLPLPPRPRQHAGLHARGLQRRGGGRGVRMACRAWRALTGEADGVAGVRAARMRLGAPTSTGRQAPEEVAGADFDLPAQLVIKALGFDPGRHPRPVRRALAEGNLRWGTVRADVKTMMTSVEGVFAAGDIARGASLVVWAITRRPGRRRRHPSLHPGCRDPWPRPPRASPR